MDYDRLRELQAKFDENPRRYFAPLANEYRKGGNPKRAIEICRAHLAQMPGHMSGQVVYGQSLFEGGEYEEARKVFEGALVLDPENLIALRSLGDLSLQAGDSPQARSWYTRLLEADPKDAAVIALIGVIDAPPPAATEEATSSELTVDFTFVDKPPAGEAGVAGSRDKSAPAEAPTDVPTV
ncbi:MAG: tetratricopeptide repeat protein, partial [Gemmatimonadota bacterium]|nr:tetratricopeptide repeat protein [Gemmatimonadota bacterium]